MPTLLTLGRVDFEDPAPDKAGKVLRQPKRLALLTYLARARDRRFVRRDQLLSLFWPELDASHARAALRRAIHFLRDALGDQVIAGRGDEELAVPADRLAIDVDGFLAALSSGNPRDALDRYAGDFLEGIYVESAPDYQRWLDQERSHLRKLAKEAAWAASERLEGPEPAEAVALGRQAVSFDHYDESAVRRLIRLLDRLGERAEALQVFEEFADRYREDLDLDPAPETVELAAAVRTSGPRYRRLKRSQPTAAARAVAILPFAVRAPEQHHYLSEGMVDLLATKLDGAGSLRAADPGRVMSAVRQSGLDDEAGPEEGRQIAQRLEAEFFLLGNVVVAGDRIRAGASLYDGSGVRLHQTEVEGEGESELFDLVDLLARQVLTSQGIRPRRLDRLSAHTTGSLPALKSYLTGEQHFRAGHFFEALDAFQNATEHDGEFALAHHRLASSLAACALPDMARESAARAAQLKSHLSPHDAMLVQAQTSWFAGDAEQAEAELRRLVERYPDDVEAWFLLGDLQIHHNPYRGRSIQQAVVALRRAANLDPDHINTLGHLARLAALSGGHDELESLARRIELLSPAGAPTLPIRALKAFATRQEVEEAQVLAELKEARALTIAVAFADVSLYAGNPEGTWRMADEMISVARSPELRSLGYLIMAHLAVERGDWQKAESEIDRAAEGCSSWAHEVRGLLAALPFTEVPANRLAEIIDQLREWNAAAESTVHDLPLSLHDGLHQHLRAYLLGHLECKAGRVAEAVTWEEELAELTAPEGKEDVVAFLTGSVRARRLLAEGKAEEALEILGALPQRIWFQEAVASPFFARALERWLRAEALASLGRVEEAAGWYRSMAQRTPFEVVYRPAASRRLATIPAEP